MPKTYRDVGLILKKHDLGEADSLVWLMTRDEGMVRAVAKGVRRLTSRKGGNVELFNQVDGLLSRGRNLDVLVEAVAIDTFQPWRQDLTLISQAYYAADLTMMLVPEGESFPVIYDQLISFYAWLGHSHHPAVLVRWFEVQLLSQLGFWAPAILRSQSQNALELLTRFPMIKGQEAARVRVSPELNAELERLMRGMFIEVLEREPKTEAFVYQVRDLNRLAEVG